MKNFDNLNYIDIAVTHHRFIGIIIFQCPMPNPQFPLQLSGEDVLTGFELRL